MWQRASWPHVCRFISAISADFHNLGTAIEKIDHFFRFRDEIGLRVTAFVKTELEYVFVLSRSIFDLLQEAIATIWETKIQLDEPGAEAKRKRQKPPHTFSKMVLRGEEVRDRGELVEQYAITPALAAAYEEVAPFFRDTRRFRDAIVHGGKEQAPIYSTEKGFCVPKDFRELYGIQVQAPDHFHNDNLVSLLPLIAHVVIGTIGGLQHTGLGFRAPDPTARRRSPPGHRVFIRVALTMRRSRGCSNRYTIARPHGGAIDRELIGRSLRGECDSFCPTPRPSRVENPRSNYVTGAPISQSPAIRRPLFLSCDSNG